MVDGDKQTLSFGVITLSDKGFAGQREDTSGKYLVETLEANGYSKAFYTILPDSIPQIVETVRDLVDDKNISLIVTTGGTGVAPTDVTPEAMEQVLEKEIPGLAELMRLESLKKTNRAALSRGKAGIRKKSLIVNLPGSLKAVKENLDAILPVLDHALEKIRGDEGDCGRDN